MKRTQYGPSLTTYTFTPPPRYSQKIRLSIIEDVTAAMMVIMRKASPDDGVKNA